MRRTACIGFWPAGSPSWRPPGAWPRSRPGPRARSDRAVRSSAADLEQPRGGQVVTKTLPIQGGDGGVRRGPDSRRQERLVRWIRDIEGFRKAADLGLSRKIGSPPAINDFGSSRSTPGAPGPRALQARRLRAPSRGSGDLAIPDRGGLGRARCGPAGEPPDAPAPPGLRGGLPPWRRRSPRRGPQRASAAARRGRFRELIRDASNLTALAPSLATYSSATRRRRPCRSRSSSTGPRAASARSPRSRSTTS